MCGKLQQALRILGSEGAVSLAGSLLGAAQWQIKSYLYQMEKYPQYWYRLKYREAVADPYSLIEISPIAVDFTVSPGFLEDLPSDKTYIRGGEWDRSFADQELYFFNGFEDRFDKRFLVPLEKYVFYRAVEDHIINGTPWSETEFYQWARQFGGFPEHILYSDRETFDWRFEQLDRLAESIEKEGYKSQRQCENEPETVSAGEQRAGTTVSRWACSDDVPPEYHEVMIDIGRDGELIFEEGRHRFAVARALGIESIPVRVFVRHEEWQKKRMQVARAETIATLDRSTRSYLSHPDMRQLHTFDI